MNITTVGIDLAKSVYQVHGVDQYGKVVLGKQLTRSQVLPLFGNLHRCLIGMDACGGARHSARRLQTLGHEERLMAPQFVKPYVRGNEHDAADAEAICKAVTRPMLEHMKNVDLQVKELEL